MTLRSCPDFRPIVVRRSAPQPRLFDVVHKNRPPLSRYSADEPSNPCARTTAAGVSPVGVLICSSWIPPGERPCRQLRDFRRLVVIDRGNGDRVRHDRHTVHHAAGHQDRHSAACVPSIAVPAWYAPTPPMNSTHRINPCCAAACPRSASCNSGGVCLERWGWRSRARQ